MTAALLMPISELRRGIGAFPRGLRWLRANPRYLFLLWLPLLLGLLCLSLTWTWFAQHQSAVFDWLLFTKPNSLLGQFFYYICKAFLSLTITILSVVFAILLTNIAACPVYEWVSVAVERDYTGGVANDLGFWHSIKLVGEELKKTAFIFTVSILILMVPGINVLTGVITAFLIGWDFFDYPLARQGWTFSERLTFVLREFWAVTGLGLWLIIPFIQILLMPLAVAGGTLLNLELQQRSAALDEALKRG